MEQSVPIQILHYALGERLAPSRTGDLYKAWDTVLERFVALKLFDLDLMDHIPYRAQVLSTLRALADTDHPNICSLYGVHKFHGRYVVALELVEGESLRERLRRGPLDIDAFLRVASALAGALNHAHSRHIVHGSLTPSNILLRDDGDVRVVDFGFSTMIVEREGRGFSPSAEAVRYRAPEQVTGEEVGPLADLFAAGAILYECLAGCPAFPGSSVEAVEEAVLHADPDFRLLQPDRKTPADIVLLLERLLAKNPADRLRHAAELQITLTEIVSFEKAAPAREFFQVAPQSPRQYLMLSLLAALLIIFWLVITSVHS
ncbi:MAG TPA: serine/threonine-protein kinase [candidate division Zixibacteria bacterium]|nr:serine/threonine protein kinase [candidate division Zixibacteria bacterium]MDD4916749.1 serine/threonine-protein kinase [candidate division Zixibacteria bacterium]MDM7973810.1 serine/threonine-protein kinase [candidate division Zixibacteria bacterium]HOD65355.1 serine/threonine-protein kinase [candidate division Zixibacteria bacterium]HPM37989.1 serine/threonine-protein kinase [candidate division Zixibacteria bacterium]